MKFLQIKQNGELLKVPEILELNSETGLFFDGTDIRIFNDRAISNCETVCSLTDCYQVRPLFETKSGCEFDVEVETENSQEYNDLVIFNLAEQSFGLLFQSSPGRRSYISANSPIYRDRINTSKNIGSIFIPENQSKYPELYQEAITAIQTNQP